VSTPTVDPVAYRPAQAAKALDVSRSRLYELMAEGVVPYRQIGGVRLIPRAALEALFDEGAEDAPA
jgi:excisionase family DNA binding protein